MRPVLFELPDWLGGHPIPSYGVVMVLGCLIGALVFAGLARREGRSFGQAFETALEPILVAIVISKLVGLLFQPESDMSPWEQLGRTGGVWYVGLLAGIAHAAWRVRRLGLGVTRGLDLAAASVAVGHGIGRLACLFAGCCYGKACEAPWGLTVASEAAHARTGVPLHEPLHPTALYESLGELSIAALLIWLLLTGRDRFPLMIGGLYLTLYAVLRFVIEFFRADARGSLGPLSTSQAIAVGLFAVMTPVLVAGWLRSRGARVDAEGRSPAP